MKIIGTALQIMTLLIFPAINGIVFSQTTQLPAPIAVQPPAAWGKPADTPNDGLV